MGDVVQSLGAVQSLITARPELELHFVTQSGNAPLLEGLGLASVISHDREGGIRGLLRTRRKLRAVSPEVAVDLQGNWKSALIARCSGASECIGAAGRHRQEPSSSVLLRRRVAIDGPGHPFATALQLLRELEPNLDAVAPRLEATTVELDHARDTLREAGLDPESPFTVFVVTNPRDNRAWHLAAMTRQVVLEDRPVIWLCGPREQGIHLPADAITVRHGPDRLRELIALGTLVRDAGGRVLGPDQGGIHVLAATGAEVAVLYGPQDPQRTAPPGARVLVKNPGPDCVPCRKRTCSHAAGPICMDFTTSESSG